jgi:hypothetical protein
MKDLPAAARRYLERLAKLCSAPLAIMGTGAAREATIMIRNPFPRSWRRLALAGELHPRLLPINLFLAEASRTQRSAIIGR